MKTENKQSLLNGKELYFDLKKIIDETGARRATVVHNCPVDVCELLHYFTEMGVELTKCDLEGITYEKVKVENALGIIDLKNTDLLIAIGDGTLLNAVKYARMKTPASKVPVLAVPSFVEAGDEANGRITFFDSKKVAIFEEENVIPEYIFYDPEVIRSDSKYDINSRFARGFCQAINIMWANDPDSPAVSYAAEGLQKLLNNATKIMRSEKSALVESLEAAYLVGSAVRYAEKKSLDESAMILSSKCGILLGHAMMKFVAPLADAIENALLAYDMISISDEHCKRLDSESISDEQKSLLNKLRSVSDIVTPGNFTIHSLSYQLKFLERAMELFGNDLEAEDALELARTVDRNMFRDMPIELDDEALRILFLHVFHKETLERAIDNYNLQIRIGRKARRNTRRIENLQEKYADDLSRDRIITDPYFERQMNRREMVVGLQNDVLETLLLSKDLLEKYNLRYYLSEGTLLGAVRHKGFIPWDDDVDIMMPREDYNKLVELDKNGLIPDELHLDALENNPKHWVLGAKLQLTRKSKYLQSKVTGLSEYNGPYIDVFPLDYWNSPYNKKQYRAQRIVKLCRRLLFMKTGYSRRLKGKFHRYLMLVILPFVPNTAIEKLAIKNMTKFNNGNRKYMVHLCSYYRFYKEVFPAGFYGEPVYKEFEGHLFPVPKEYDFMLQSIYGLHYDTLPPARVAALRNHPFEVVEDAEETEEAED